MNKDYQKLLGHAIHSVSTVDGDLGYWLLLTCLCSFYSKTLFLVKDACLFSWHVGLVLVL